MASLQVGPGSGFSGRLEVGDRILHSPQRGSVELVPTGGSDFEVLNAIAITLGQ